MNNNTTNHFIQLEQFFCEVFNEANKQQKKQVPDTPKSAFFKTVYSKVKKYTQEKSKNKQLPNFNFSKDYYEKELKPGIHSLLGEKVKMSDGKLHGGKDTFEKLGIRKRERFLMCIKDTIENPGFIYYEKPKNENSSLVEDKCPTEFYVNLYHSVNERNQLENIWVCAVIRIYPDGAYLVSIYPYKNESELREKVLASDKIYDVEKRAWVNGPEENKTTDSGYSPSEPITAQAQDE